MGTRGTEQQTTRRGSSTRRGDTGRVVAYWDGGYAEIELPAIGAMVIGRDRGSELCIPHPSVSRRHARLRLEEQSEIEDLGSVNGTRLNGRPVGSRSPTPVPDGAIVEVGDAIIVLRRADGRVERTGSEATLEPSMRSVRELVERVAKGNIPVTLVGETGVGKELLADRLHTASHRAGAPFLRINCAALPEQLLESELFGYERGAFTGATQSKPGLLESAHGGTVFLDEVGELPKATQAKLLRALECKEIFRVGSLRPRTFDVRFVAATNRDLEAMVRSGDFRADLFHRLCGVVVHVPPLRERLDEIDPLARSFARDVAQQLGREVPSFAPGFFEVLRRHAWPGNVRELRHTIECAVLVATESTLDVAHLPRSVLTSPPAASNSPASSLKAELDSLEKQRIVDALDRCGGNQTRTAQYLGIPRRTLIDRIEAYGLPRPRKRRAKSEG